MRKNSGVKTPDQDQRADANKAISSDLRSELNKVQSKSRQSFTPSTSPVSAQYSISPSKQILEVSENAYYVSSLQEGYGNIEEVSENEVKTNFNGENKEEEIFTATLLDLDYFHVPDSKTENFSSSISGSIDSYVFPNNSNSSSRSDSDSDTNSLFVLFSDTSSDEEFTSLLSAGSNIGKRHTSGNLPNFDELEKEVFKPPLNALVSKRIPTATSTYSSSSTVEGPSYILEKPHSSSDQYKNDHNKEKRETLVTTKGQNTGTFCSTDTQSALLSKITPDRNTAKLQQSSIDNFLKMQMKRKPLGVVSPVQLVSKSGPYREVEVDLENFETEVGKAFEESVNEGSLMPLLKQELQCKIQVRRLSMGQSELVLGPEEPKIYKLTEDEIKKKQARLEQNRKSAKKSRRKARKYEQTLLNHISKEMTKNAKLRNELSTLLSTRDKYKALIDQHLMSCAATTSLKSNS